MRGFQTDGRAQTVCAGHEFIRNLAGGIYDLGVELDVPGLPSRARRGLRSSLDRICVGEAASVRMGGVKRGVARAKVETGFRLGDRADPLGRLRTRTLIV